MQTSKRADIKTRNRIVRVTQVGNGRYLAIARLLPFLKAGDIVDVTSYVYSDNDFLVEIKPYEYVEVIEPKRTKKRKSKRS